MVVKNKEFPPLPKDEAEREFYETQGVIYLDDEFEKACINAFFKSLDSSELGLKLNVDLVKEYAKFYEFEFLDFYEILNAILNSVNKESAKKAKR